MEPPATLVRWRLWRGGAAFAWGADVRAAAALPMRKNPVIRRNGAQS
jgi:hypothetical protein